jgi:hypothetical protein
MVHQQEMTDESKKGSSWITPPIGVGTRAKIFIESGWAVMLVLAIADSSFFVAMPGRG